MEHAIERPATISPATLEKVLIGGDLSKLSESQRVEYYAQTCTSLGLNPLTKPFDYITLNGKLTLYAKRDAADQLRRIYGVSITKLEREQMGDVYAVTAYASLPDGRTDSSMGAVNTKGLAGEALANALMKAETKAKRRVTLSICGLGMLDETEVSTIPSAAKVVVSQETGEIIDATPQPSSARPYSPEELKSRIKAVAESWTGTVSDKQRGLIAATLDDIYQDEGIRKEVQFYLTGFASLKEMPDGYAHALLKWLNPQKMESGDYAVDDDVLSEAPALINAARLAAGQQPLPL